jgi:hypothetical protein
LPRWAAETLPDFTLCTALRAVPAAPDPELARQQHLYDILLSFCDRAFRRPATHDEVTRLLGIVLSAEKDGEQTELALQLAFRAVLVSPHFLFLGNKIDHDTVSASDSLPINDFDLASRISYFLWSSMPDEQLLRVAAQGLLRRREHLRLQVKRMLRDPKARALAENVASQWLQTRKLKDFTPDPALYPAFDESLREAMLTETELFFQSVRDKDRSVLEFLDADYTFVNDRLARFYGIAGVTGDGFRRVSLAGTSRGGVLTQASVLNDHDTNTSRPPRVECGTGAVTDRLVGRTTPRRGPTDLIFARQALDRRRFAEAERHLRRTLDAEPESADVRTLMGVLHDRLGEFHAAYQCYKLALEFDRHNVIARAGLRRYCERFGLEIHRNTINPSLDEPAND